MNVEHQLRIILRMLRNVNQVLNVEHQLRILRTFWDVKRQLASFEK